MNYESLFRIEIVDGAVKVTPSEELKSMPIDQQIATLESKLRMYKTELLNINNQVEENLKEGTSDSDKCELELVIVILKNFLKQFREANWERINP
jgi:flagellar biosynthesis chaperone FliJ